MDILRPRGGLERTLESLKAGHLPPGTWQKDIQVDFDIYEQSRPDSWKLARPSLGKSILNLLVNTDDPKK